MQEHTTDSAYFCLSSSLCLPHKYFPYYAPMTHKTANSKTLSGLLEFENKTEAAEALTVLNHHQIWMPSESHQKNT